MSDIRRYAETALAIQKELPVEERELAHKIYISLIQIERMTYAWPHLGGWAGVVVGVAIAMGVNFPAVETSLGKIAIFGYYLAWFLIGVGICKFLFTNSKRAQALHRLKGLQIADSRSYAILQNLKKLDPRIFQNVEKFLPKV